MICEYIKRHKAVTFFAAVLLALSLIAAAIQASPLPKFIPMETGECVGFYGTAGAVIWAIVAFAVQNNDKEKELEYRPALELVVDSASKGQFLGIRLANAGLHAVRNVRLEGNVIASYVASEEAACFELLADSETGKLRLSKKVGKRLFQNFIEGISFCEDRFPSELHVTACDLRGQE